MPKPDKIEDVEMLPDAWERTERAMKVVARHKPMPRPAPKAKPAKPGRSVVRKKRQG